MAAERMLRRFLIVFVPASLVMAVAAFILARQEQAAVRAMERQGACHSVRLHSESIARELEAMEADLLYLAEQRALLDLLEHDGPEQRRALAEELRLFSARRGVYDQIRYLDESGTEVVRVNDRPGGPEMVPAAELQAKGHREYFNDTLELGRRHVYVSRFDLNLEHGVVEQPLKPVIRLATAVFDGRGQRRGILILNYIGQRLLDALATPAEGAAGRLLLIDHEGYWLRGPAAGVEWGLQLGRDERFGGTYPLAWRQIASAEQGELETEEGFFAFETPVSERRTDGNRRAAGGIKLVAAIPLAASAASFAHILPRVLPACGIALGLLGLFAFFLARAAVVRRRDQEELRESERQLRELSKQLLRAQEQERQRVSRDLHDDLGQLLTAVCLDVERAARLPDGPKRDHALQRAAGEARGALDRVREIATSLRPPILDDLGLKRAVQSYLAEFEARTGIETEADLRCDGIEVPPATSEHLYRILQEALTNAWKHAGAERIFVSLDLAVDRAVLSVRDSGVGFAPESISPATMGVASMRERVELLGGDFELVSSPGGGTRVRASVPLSEAAPHG